jgi:pimeloyl-ACP methyl ester carboxylesterase
VTLVLLHGAGETPALWERVVPHLIGIPTIVPALPGRAGVAWGDEAKRDVAAYARTVIAEMDRHAAATATIAGHSLGGAIALHLALEYPERVSAVGLIATGARLRVRPDVLDALNDGVKDVLDVLVNGQTTPRTSDRDRVVLKRMLESVPMEQTHEDLMACDGFDVMAVTNRIRTRALVLAGEDDLVTPIKYSRYLAETIVGARLVAFPGVGHAVPLERAEEVAGELAVLWAASQPLP